MVYTVALTGGIGSGKSTVANIFSRCGAAVIDADVIARQIVKPGTWALESIAKYFGKKILLPNGTLNRIALRKRIFSYPEERIWLNHLLHPLIHRHTQNQLQHSTASYALWVVPLLIENRLEDYADRVLVINAHKEMRVARTAKRDGIAHHEVQDIISAQATCEHRLAAADDVIQNNEDCTKKMALLVEILHHRYIKLAGEKSSGMHSNCIVSICHDLKYR